MNLRFSPEDSKTLAKAAEIKAARPKKVTPLRGTKPTEAVRERRPRERDNGLLQFVRRLPCIVCAAIGRNQATPTEAPRIRTGYREAGRSYAGKAEKPDDFRTVRLCGGPSGHHAAQQARGDEAAWWAEQGLYPPAAVAVFVKARAEGRDGIDVVREAIRAARLRPVGVGHG